MKRFHALFRRLDETTRTNEKLAALEAYFREARPENAAWALWVLTGGRVKRAVSGKTLRAWIAEEARLPLWLLETSYRQVGDLAETLALVYPDRGERVDRSLDELMREVVLPLPALDDARKREHLIEALDGLAPEERLVFLKLVTGAFRVGVGARLVTRALAAVAGVDASTMALRLAGDWSPDAETLTAFLGPETEDDPRRPYPFFLAHPLQEEPGTLGDPDAWQVEWKWDGIRLQLIRRGGRVLLWSRGGEIVTYQFPEIVAAAEGVPDGTVLDGEALAWRDGAPLPFLQLQRRLGRKKVGPKLRGEVPVALLAYDLLEEDGVDLRQHPLRERRERLESLVEEARTTRLETLQSLHLSSLVEAGSWEALAELRKSARERGVEGFMLKERSSEYGVGRPRGHWWKWKVDPLHIDAVLLYAQPGSGRRAGLFTDYTFGVWDGEELVPVAKAYSGLDGDEIARLDRWIRRHTVDRFGPVRAVEREHVFELAFDGIRSSSRHKSGVALRFPRIARWRDDKRVEEAETLEGVRALLEVYGDG